VANNLVQTFPHGLDVEVMSRGTLAIAAAKATAPYDREHVTPWITRADAGGAIFRLGNLPCPVDMSNYRLTVDHEEDLRVVRAIYERFAGPRYFTTAEVIAFLGVRPDLMLLNARHRSQLQPMGQA
jgi:spore coat polysaccharide biosynthesis protein SpsF